jgi:hypothetical protein
VTVKVIDAVMGVGKTTRVFQMMKDNPDKRYLYISIFNGEVGDGNANKPGRIHSVLPELDFKMPINSGEGKVEGLKKLLSYGCNVSTTHALFRVFDNEVVDLLIKGGYTMYIDEAVDCVSVYEDLDPTDIRDLYNNKWILVDEVSHTVSWNEALCPDHVGQYKEVRDLCNSGCLYLYNMKALVSEYPPRLLRELRDIFIITYLFEGSTMSSWMKANIIPYEYVDNNELGLLDEKEVKKIIRQNLTLLVDKKLDLIEDKYDNRYGSTWYKRSSKPEKTQIKKALENCVARQKAKCGDVFWTTFLAMEDHLKGKGYTSHHNGLPSMLAFNTKATNDYKDYWLCMYTVNLFKNPTELGYLKSRGVDFNQDLFALSEMLQFLWRGAIRCGKPMKVLVLSKRMRKLLMGWLNE